MTKTRQLLLTLLAALGVTAAVGPAAAARVATAPVQSSLCGLIPTDTAKNLCNAAGAVGKSVLPEQVTTVFEAFTPQNILETWAIGMAQSSASLLQGMQTLLLNATMPDFSSGWFITRYCIMFGLGLIIMAFVLVRVTSHMAAGGDSNQRPEVLVVMREAGARAIFFVPVVTIVPSLVYLLSKMSYGMAAVFGDQSTKSAKTAIQWYTEALGASTDPRTVVTGGVLSLFVLAGIVFVGAMGAMVEMVIAEYGLFVALLLLPLLFAIAINPRWRKAATIIITTIIALLLVPAAIFFAYWVLWGMIGDLPGSDPIEVFKGMLLIGVGTLAVIALPVLLGFLIGALMDSAPAERAIATGGRVTGASTSMVTRGLGGLKRSAATMGSGGRGAGSFGGRGAAPAMNASPAGPRTNGAVPTASGAAATNTPGARSMSGSGRGSAGKASQETAGTGMATGAATGAQKGASTGADAGMKVAGPKGAAVGGAVGAGAGAVTGPAAGAAKGTREQLSGGLGGRHSRTEGGKRDGDN